MMLNSMRQIILPKIKFLNFDIDEDNTIIVRVFPMKNYKKIDHNNKKEIHNYGVLYLNKNNLWYKIDEETAFDYIPNHTDTTLITNEAIPIEVKPSNYNTLYKNGRICRGIILLYRILRKTLAHWYFVSMTKFLGG